MALFIFSICCALIGWFVSRGERPSVKNLSSPWVLHRLFYNFYRRLFFKYAEISSDLDVKFLKFKRRLFQKKHRDFYNTLG